MVLDFIFFLLSLYILVLFFIPETETTLLKKFSIWISGIVLILSTYLLITFKLNTFYFQNITSFNLGSSLFNIKFLFGLDGISILFFFFNYVFIFFMCYFYLKR